MAKKLIDLIGISKSYGDKVILDDLNLYLNENRFLTILGPSGCGKTTTLRILGGFGGSTGTSGGNNYLMEFLISQLSPEQQQLFEQFQGFTNETGNDEEQQ